MPKKLDRCVRKVRKKIRSGEIPKTYKTKKGRRKKSSAWAICRTALGKTTRRKKK